MLRPLKLGRSPYTLLCSSAEAEAVHSLDCMLIEIYVRFLRPVHCPSSPSGPNHYVATAAAATTTQGRTSLCRRTAKAINVGAAPEWVQHAYGGGGGVARQPRQ